MPSWGSYPWASGPWAGGYPVTDFNLFCFYDASMSSIVFDPDASVVGSGLHFLANPVTLDLEVCGGGSAPTTEGTLYLTKNIPQDFTVEWVVNFANLPNDFTDLVNQHIYLGVTDAAGPLAGLFFSKIGVAYTGSVSFSSGGDLQLETVFQQIPGSSSYINETDYWHIRIAASWSVGVVYLYMTKASEIHLTGHQLRAILPVIPYTAAVTVPTDQTMISVRGTATLPVCAYLDRWCAADSVIIPNLAPVADAGQDQATRTCSIIQLDGGQSFDPEGASLTYSWRLIEAPMTSTFSISKEDGTTTPLAVPTGFTDKFYSLELGAVDAVDPIGVGAFGDVLVVDGTSYTISATGTDGSGFYVQLFSEVLPDNLVGQYFKVLRQNGVSDPDTVRPTFYPDVPGFYSFDLMVFDGNLWSAATSSTIVNVLESPLPRGCTPNLSFLFNYLSDFWNLVDGKERVSALWGAMAQATATELYTLWQYEYSKSLRDIQRLFVRRWLHYDLLLAEPIPELTTVRALYGGVESSYWSSSSGIAGTTFELASDVLSADVSVVVKLIDPVTPAALAAWLGPQLQAIDSRFSVEVLEDRATGNEAVRIDAPFPFSIGAGSTVPVFTAGAEDRPPSGSSGAAVGVRTYKVDRSLYGLGVAEDDFLVLDGVAYRVVNVVSSAADTYLMQRVVVKEDLPAAPSSSWSLVGWVQSELLDFYNGMVDQEDHVDFIVSEISDENAPTVAVNELVETTALGANAGQPSRLAFDVWPVGAYIANSALNVFLARVVRRHYLPVDSVIKDIPALQEKIVIEDDEATLRRNLDFYIEEARGRAVIRFASGLGADPGDVWEGARPSDRLWAEYTYLDNSSVIEDNFGLGVELTVDMMDELPSNVDYLSAVRGLYYAFYNGPTIYSMRVGVQILLGLPFAEEQGVIEEIRTDFSPNHGRVLVRDTKQEEIVRSYSFPVGLSLETSPTTGRTYEVGDTVARFAPLVAGVEVIDWVNNPTWFEGLLNQGVFYEVEKFHKFVVRVEEEAFSLTALLFARNFVLKIKPLHTFPMFIVRRDIGDSEVSITDNVSYLGTLSLHDSMCAPLLGTSWLYDQPRAAGGGCRNQYDSDTDPSTTPTFPTPESPVLWGFDKTYLCPLDELTTILYQTFAASFTPPYDSVFAYDTAPTSNIKFQYAAPAAIPVAPGLALTPIGSALAPFTGNLTLLRLAVFGTPGADPTDYEAVVFVNGTLQATEAFTAGTNTEIARTISVAATAGDTISVGVQVASGVGRTPSWSFVSATVTQEDQNLWTFDDTLAAGTYSLEKLLS